MENINNLFINQLNLHDKARFVYTIDIKKPFKIIKDFSNKID